MAYQATMQEEKLRKGPWLEEEDEQLITYVSFLGERRWDSIARASGLRRSGKSCRLRWLNYLRPNLKHGPISAEEEQTILQLHERWGNKWAKIARKLPGRTDNEIKNYWRTRLRKREQVQEQENYRCIIKNAKHHQVTEEGDMGCPHITFEDCSSSKDFSGTTIDSFDVLGLSNFVASSPYEIRFSEWTMGLSNEQGDMEHLGDYISSDLCFSYPAYIFGDGDSSIWEYSGGLWNMD